MYVLHNIKDCDQNICVYNGSVIIQGVPNDRVQNVKSVGTYYRIFFNCKLRS